MRNLKYSRWRKALFLAGCICLAGLSDHVCAEESPQVAATPSDHLDSPTFSISGYGFFNNRAMHNAVSLLMDQDSERRAFSANFVEDSVLILLSRLQHDGYLKPEIETILTLDDGSETSYRWDLSFATNLPRNQNIKRIEFHLIPGVFYTLDSIQFDGLESIKHKQARSYFIGESFLFNQRSSRLYAKNRVSAGMDSLTDVLNRNGYIDATVEITEDKMDDTTGKVVMVITVNEGPRYVVRGITEAVTPATNRQEGELLSFVDKPWSRWTQQDIAQDLRNRYLKAGYPDVAVSIVPKVEAANQAVRMVDLDCRVETGPLITIGEIIFRGAVKTRRSVLDGRLELSPGEPLNRLELEEARYRLGRLGLFKTINLDYEVVSDTIRNPVYTVTESRTYELNLLLGYGSYELLRGGIEFNQYNLWGLAHRSTLLISQSFKSSSGSYAYTVPEIFGAEVDGTSRLFGLRRVEQSFISSEYGGNLGLQTILRPLDIVTQVTYTFKHLKTEEIELSPTQEGSSESTVGSLDFSISKDKRDDPLLPHKGYRYYGNVEWASRYFGGEADYQRVEFGVSIHRVIADGLWIHGSVVHGILFNWGGTQEDIPFNKRFYPGGENSVRGYQSGEAAPRAADGKFVGAESYILGNIELEQALASKWAGVLFLDGVGFSEKLANYPSTEGLYSAGLGLRYRTVVGIIRLEYGYNLNPRPQDPSGTLHFSVGYPF
ncbi:MAG: BamA/TamA family outer membrane protein [Verrucomicrobiota bacterium]|nr:BamA/TamA family outer membrane protein [Verrucomicrobiota bacterium]